MPELTSFFDDTSLTSWAKVSCVTIARKSKAASVTICFWENFITSIELSLLKQGQNDPVKKCPAPGETLYPQLPGRLVRRLSAPARCHCGNARSHRRPLQFQHKDRAQAKCRQRAAAVRPRNQSSVKRQFAVISPAPLTVWSEPLRRLRVSQNPHALWLIPPAGVRRGAARCILADCK